MEESEFRHITFNDLTAEMITKAALNGDPLAIEAYEYTGMLLGHALADAVTITSPEAIFLFGGLAKAGKYIFRADEEIYGNAHDARFPQQGEAASVGHRRQERGRARRVRVACGCTDARMRNAGVKRPPASGHGSS